jgi:hypothetical protein
VRGTGLQAICRQREGFDFHETYAPVTKHATVRTLFALAAAHDLDLHHLDISTAFLNGELEEEVYVQQPPGFPVGPKGKVCKLKKALYGLKQAPMARHSTFTNTL